MAIPDFQSAMLPILRLTADGEEHSIAEALDLLAAEFGTTDEFDDFDLAHPAAPSAIPEAAPAAVSVETPDEVLERSYQLIQRRLAEELREQLKSCSPSFFEQLVVDLLVSLGYGGSRPDVASAVGRSGDEGLDGVIKEDALGLAVAYETPTGPKWRLTLRRAA